MRVTDLEMAVLQAQITGNGEMAGRAFGEKLAVPGGLGGLAALVHAAFVIAARRGFTPRWSGAEVIRYVARVRTLLSERPALLGPLTAEDELRGAPGEPVTAAHEIGAVAAARLCLLLALAASLDLDEEAVADLLGQARGIANRMPGHASSLAVGMGGRTGPYRSQVHDDRQLLPSPPEGFAQTIPGAFDGQCHRRRSQPALRVRYR